MCAKSHKQTSRALAHPILIESIYSIIFICRSCISFWGVFSSFNFEPMLTPSTNIYAVLYCLEGERSDSTSNDRFLFERHYTYNKMASGPTTFTHLIMYYLLRIHNIMFLYVYINVCVARIVYLAQNTLDLFIYRDVYEQLRNKATLSNI